MKTYTIIVASGSGLRMGYQMKKQYISLSGKPILYHTLSLFSAHTDIDRIILVVPEEDKAFVSRTIISHFHTIKQIQMVSGGNRRQDSVYKGLSAIDAQEGIVLIHDGVRPFLLPSHIRNVIDGARKKGACILGIPATDTLKQVDQNGVITQTLDRKKIWMAQTPQAFRIDLIKKAYQTAMDKGLEVTDDASLAELLGVPIQFIMGSKFNIKITTPEDLVFAEAVFNHQFGHLR